MSRKVHGNTGVPKSRSCREKISASLRARAHRLRECERVYDELKKNGIVIDDKKVSS